MDEYIKRSSIQYLYIPASWGADSEICKAYNEGVKAVQDSVDAIPAADVVEVKRGRWMPHMVLGQKEWFCSKCRTLGSPQWKCCPVCTAFMDGKGDDND